ncbi:MAG: FkbM family methyltransferase [Rhodobacteraceae bacterium]|jgi:FkbM family methyltransferase|nr:FkbM family methyltransferase [Paracoccaceae bacterium]
MARDITDADTDADLGILESRGLRFPLDRTILRLQTRRNLRAGTYEAKETAAVLATVTPGDRVLELGAGIGYMSALMARHIGPAAITCVEANPRLIPYIARVHALSGVTGIRVLHGMLGAAAGTAPFYVRTDFIGASADDFTGRGKDTPSTRHDVPVLAAADVLADLRPTVLVCDIEGAEATVLPLMDLSGLRAAILELHPQWVGAAGIAAVFAAMARAGLHYFPRTSQGKVVTFRREF